MSAVTRVLFALILCAASSSAWAKHSVQISYLNLPELKARMAKVLEQNGYTFKVIGNANKMEQVVATHEGETNRPSPAFLVELFFHNFVEYIAPVLPFEGRTKLKVRIAENLSRVELAELFGDLQAGGAWIEFARLTPPFNFIANFEKQKQTEILKLLEKYEYIDQYQSQSEDPSETHFLNDRKRRGIANINITLLVPFLIPTVLESFPPEVLAVCVYKEQEGSEFDKLIMTCPNEFALLQKIYDSVAGLEVNQALRIAIDGEYTNYMNKRNTSHIFEEEDYKRLVLEPRRDRAVEMAKNSPEYGKLKEISKPEELSMNTYKLGMRLMRELIHALGYDVFKLIYRHDDESNPVQQIYVELSDEGISHATLSKLLEDFNVYPYLDNGHADYENELKSSKDKNCEYFLSAAKK